MYQIIIIIMLYKKEVNRFCKLSFSLNEVTGIESYMKE